MIIYQDKKEKKGWDFSFAGVTTERKSLKTGDYTVAGYEDLICVERKGTTGELAFNLGKYYSTFKKELERMQTFRFRWIVCEFTYMALKAFPEQAGFSEKLKSKIKIRGNYLCSQVNKIKDTYNVDFIFCRDELEAYITALDLMNGAVDVIRTES